MSSIPWFPSVVELCCASFFSVSPFPFGASELLRILSSKPNPQLVSRPLLILWGLSVLSWLGRKSLALVISSSVTSDTRVGKTLGGCLEVAASLFPVRTGNSFDDGCESSTFQNPSASVVSSEDGKVTFSGESIRVLENSFHVETDVDLYGAVEETGEETSVMEAGLEEPGLTKVGLVNSEFGYGVLLGRGGEAVVVVKLESGYVDISLTKGALLKDVSVFANLVTVVEVPKNCALLTDSATKI